MRKFLVVLLSGVVLFSSSSCKKDKSQAELDEEAIVSYISEHSLDFKKDASGVYYNILDGGDVDKKPELDSRVIIKYEASILNGDVFSKTDEGKAESLILSDAYVGMGNGLQLIGEGGVIQLIIPSRLASGSSVLYYEIGLVSVVW